MEIPLLLCIFWLIFKNISKRRNNKVMGVDTDTGTNTAQ
jgi:hypothetical protein